MYPLLALLRQGATPEQLAWSLAVGVVIGINPLIGSTTLLCLAVAFLFRLNIIASQLANHLSYPLELLLLIPFLRVGSLLFRTRRMPFSPEMLLHMARTEPLETTKILWSWEWHALVIWAVSAAFIMPAIALSVTPLLRRMLRRQLRTSV